MRIFEDPWETCVGKFFLMGDLFKYEIKDFDGVIF